MTPEATPGSSSQCDSDHLGQDSDVLVHVQIAEPWELVPDTPRGANVRAQLPDAELRAGKSASGPVVAVEGLDFDVESVRVRTRYEGESLARLLDGRSVNVNGELLVAGREPLRFIASVHDAAKAVGPWLFHDHK
jgi:hypothetical protein